MFNASLPKLLSGAMIGQLEPDGRLELLELPRSNLDVEIVPLIADLQNLGPGETIHLQPVSINQKARSANPQHNIDSFGILSVVQIDPVHSQLLSVLQVVQLGLGGTLMPVSLMQFHDFILELLRLIRGELEVLQVVSAHRFGVVIPELRLH